MTENKMFKKTLVWQALPLIAVILAIIILPDAPTEALAAGYILSFFFVFSNILLIEKLWFYDNELFMKAFYISLPIRFVLVLAAFGTILGVTKIHEIYFTVSFIISYLFNSVTELIFILKILQKRTK